ncbi:MAG: CTP synthase [Candidatus Aquicultor sp.]|nr:CTP synthase [Candidatus Aquicultor sp.]
MAKYIFVTGGVVSSLGKGITAASLGRLLKTRGFKVTIQKLDPYLNVDPGTMSPFQHGEVFVTEDGTETDLDLGHYERFIDENLGKGSNVTAGQIYWSIVTKERRGEFLGGTVQVIPHVTNEIKQRILSLGSDDDKHIVITEVGGTVGDIESLPFLEAIRQFKKDAGKSNVLYIHVTLVPHLKSSSELKTKPTQHSVKELRSIGIQPDIIVARCDRPIDVSIKRKIGLFCDTEPSSVITAVDVDNLYVIPLRLHEEGLDDIVVEHLKLGNGKADLSEWNSLVERISRLENKIRIGLVGKYVQLPDAYLSVVEALKHGGFYNNTDVEIVWVDAETVSQEEVERQLVAVDGILVPGGFGIRGIEGKIHAVKFARENKIPFFGICLGMQCAVVEFARNVVGYEDANSSEFEPATKHPVIDLLPEQKSIEDMGGTMRLGAYPCKLTKKTFAHEAYGTLEIQERHRHRYEVNNDFVEALGKAGLTLSGESPDGKLVEIVEIADHPWFVGTQFHPEFKSRPTRPHPLFRDFIGAALRYHLGRGKAASIHNY